MKDYIVRAIAADSQIRAFAAVTTEPVETARQDQHKSGGNCRAGTSSHSRFYDGCDDEGRQRHPDTAGKR